MTPSQWKAYWFIIGTTIVLLGLMVAAGVFAQEYDVLDKDGRRAGTIRIDPHDSTRVDLYDKDRRRSGWGVRDPRTGATTIYGLDGRRQFDLRPQIPLYPSR